MTTEYLTDYEVAVIIDCLAIGRAGIRARALNPDRLTTNIDSALAKINGMMTPATSGLYLTDDEYPDEPVLHDRFNMHSSSISCPLCKEVP